MKIAVTGASGFIGRHVLVELAEREVEIVAVTRDTARLTDLDAQLTIVAMDLSLAKENCFDLLGRPDGLIHLAWDGLPNYSSLHHFEIELTRQYRFLKAMVKAGLDSMLVTGTCFEYGMQSGPLSEDLPTMPNNPYGHAKDALRRQLEFLQAAHGFNFTWTRLFYMYGEGQSDTALYPQLRQAVRRGDRIFNMSGGEQLRDYLPVRAVARHIVGLALDCCNAGVVNVCSGQPVSIRKLVEGWLEENGWRIELNLGNYPYPDYEPMAFWGDRVLLDSLRRSS
ncbi:MAG: NAD-dependent epimerase/dehydratase family protein [Desulfomonilaceae bacterium]